MSFEGRELGCIRGERIVFAGLDFTLARGGALLLTGPNGSGKSSLLRLMAGLLAPAHGTIAWDGTPIAEAGEAHRARLRFVGHLHGVKPVLSAAENLLFWARLRGHGADEVHQALADLALESLADVPARMLSSGQTRRLALCRLLIGQSDLWLLDEPSVGLDDASLARLTSAFAAHRAAGGAIVVATHVPLDLPGAARLDLAAFQAPQDVLHAAFAEGLAGGLLDAAGPPS